MADAPATHRQPSRKGKKAWRKNVDIRDLQQGLQEVREQVVLGGVVAEKTDRDLFATDIIGDSAVAERQRGTKLLKANEILAMRSAVPGLEGRKRKATENTVPRTDKRPKSGSYVSHRELRRLRAVADGDRRLATQEESVATHDPWGPPEVEENPALDFLERPRREKEPKTLKAPPRPLTQSGKRISAVRKPDAGKSYNPLVGDWSALFEREGEKAVAAERSRLATDAAREEQEARAIAEAAKVDAGEREEDVTDYDSAWGSEWGGFESEAEEVWTQKQKSRKTAAEQRKSRAKKEREARDMWERKQRLRVSQEKRITQIAKEVSLKDKARRAHAMALVASAESSDDESEDDVTLQRRRFGKLPLPEAPLEVVLPDELEDSLRRLKPEGDLLTERYRNMLVNSKIEVRKRQWQHKKPKVERSEKWSYKDWRLR